MRKNVEMCGGVWDTQMVRRWVQGVLGLVQKGVQKWRRCRGDVQVSCQGKGKGKGKGRGEGKEGKARYGKSPCLGLASWGPSSNTQKTTQNARGKQMRPCSP